MQRIEEVQNTNIQKYPKNTTIQVATKNTINTRIYTKYTTIYQNTNNATTKHKKQC